MNERRKKQLSGHSGFTLVELIVVLVLLAIVSAITVPTFTQHIERAKAKECQTNMKALVASLDEMRVTNPNATMKDVLEAHAGDITCPSGGTYTLGTMPNADGIATVALAPEEVDPKDMAFYCSAHGPSEVISRSGSTITAKAGKEGMQKDENPINPEKEEELKQPDSSESTEATEPTESDVVYTVTFDANGGTTGGETQTVKGGDLFAMPAQQPTREGYTFQGWFTAASGGTQVVTPYAVNSNMTFYAQWKQKDPTIAVNIQQDSLLLEVGKTATLSAIVTTDAPSYNLQWGLRGDTVISFTEAGNEVSVNGIKVGDAVVTCTASVTLSDGRVISASDEATVTVEEAVKDDQLLKNLSEPVLINGGEGGTDIGQFENVKGGKWSSSDTNIIEFKGNAEYNKRAVAKNKGECTLTYTKDGQSASMRVRVVYPHTSLEIQRDGATHIDLHINDTYEINAVVTAYDYKFNKCETTDEPIFWSNSNPNVIQMAEAKTDSINSTVTVTAVGIGTSTITARLRNEFTGNWSEKSFDITVVYNPITGLSVDSVIKIMEDETQTVNVGFIPSENVDLSNVKLVLNNYGPNSVDAVVEDYTIRFTGKKPGTNNVNLGVERNGTLIQGVGIDLKITVMKNPNKQYQEVPGDNNNLKFALSQWDDLKQALQKNETPALSNLYYTVSYDPNGDPMFTTYIRKPEATLTWNEEYNEEMSFDEYLEVDGNKEKFIKVTINRYYMASYSSDSWVDSVVGSIFTFEEKYYVCLKEPKNRQMSSFIKSGEFAQYFVELAVAN